MSDQKSKHLMRKWAWQDRKRNLTFGAAFLACLVPPMFPWFRAAIICDLGPLVWIGAGLAFLFLSDMLRESSARIRNLEWKIEQLNSG